jgi:FKBP-type peptidyl-prolyl cis-trans isomerase (trigger factor)
MTAEAWRDELRQQATRQIKARLLLDEVADKEELTVSAGEVEAEIGRTAGAYGERAPEVRRSLSTEESRRRLAASLRRQKAIERVVGYAGGYPQSPYEAVQDEAAPDPDEEPLAAAGATATVQAEATLT